MALTRLQIAYFITMIVAGFVIGAVVVARPSWGQAFLPPAVWPFGVSLAFDVVFGLAGRAAGPITMTDRVAGIVAAGLIVTAMQAFSS
jgi:hypothetical protein